MSYDTIDFTHLEVEDVPRGHEVTTLDLSSLPGKVAVSPAGDFAYVTTATGMAVVDLITLAPPVFMDVEGGLDDLGVAPGGGSIFAISSSGQKYYRFSSDNSLGPENEIDLSAAPLGILVGPTGRRAYIAVEGGEIQVWDTDLSSGTFENQIGSLAQVDLNLLGDMAMDPSGDRLFALTGTGNLQVFDVASADLIGEVAVQSDPVAVIIEPAGQYAYITDHSGYVTVVSLSTLEAVAGVPTLGDLRGAAVTPTGSYLYAANYENDHLDVIDLRQGQPTFRNIVAQIPSRVNPVDLAFSPDGVFAYSLVQNERKFVVSAMGAGPILTSASPPAGPVGTQVVLAGSGFLAATDVTVNGYSAPIEPGATDRAMTIVIPTGAETGPLTVVTADPGKVSNSLTFQVLEAGDDGSMRLSADPQPAGDPELGPVLAVSPVGGQLAVAGESGGDIHLLDTRPGSLTFHQFTPVGTGFSDTISSLAFSPDGETAFAVSSGSADLVIIDTGFGNLNYGQPISTVPFAGIHSDHLAVSPDGSLVLVADSGSFGVWVVDPVAGTASLMPIAEGVVSAMAFHPGGAYAYLAVNSTLLVILDLTDPAIPVHAGTLVLPGTEFPVSLAFTPDGTECYVLTSDMVTTPGRSVVVVDTSNPTLPIIAAIAGTFTSTEPLTTDNLILSPVGDRAMVSISNGSGSDIFTASLSPWTVDPLPTLSLTAQEIGMAYGPDGRALFIVDPSTDQILTFDFLGDQRMVPVWGEDQTGVIGEVLPSPLRVRVVDQDDEGSMGVPVTFTVGSGGGYISVPGDPNQHQELTLATGAIGYAQVNWVLGMSEGSQSVQVTSQGVAGSPFTYSATAITDPELLPLELVSDLLAPAAGSADVSVTTAIQAVFTKSVDPATIFESSYFLYDIAAGAVVPVVFGFSDLDRRVSMTPATPLDFGKAFRIIMTNSIRDLDGGELTNPLETLFSTELPPVVPTLSSISPPSAAALVGLVLSGSGFDPNPANNQVRFYPAGGGAYVSSYIIDSATDFIRTTVPLVAETGTVTVYTNGSESNSLPFTVLTPTTSPADDVVANVRTGSPTKSVTVSPDGALAYAVSPEADLMIPVDLGLGGTQPASLPGIPVGDEPWALATHPDGTYIYVANRLSGDVAVVDTDPASPTWHEVVEYVPVGQYPVDLVVSPIGDRVYVANSESDDLSVIDADDSSATFNGVIGNVAVGGGAKSVTVSPDGARIYIGTEDGYLVLGSLEYGVIASVSTGRGTRSVTVSPDGALLVVLDSLGELKIFDVAPGSGSENEVIANVRTGSTVKSATVSPDGALLMAVLSVGDVIEVFGLDIGVSVSVMESEVYGSITDLPLLATLQAGENPQIIAFDPTGSGRFVVTNAGDNTMSVFEVGQPTGPGWLEGTVAADCPDPGTALLGVEVDVFSTETGELQVSMITDEAGHYEAELDPGTYNVSVVLPLGYTIEEDVRAMMVASADTQTLDWPLTCQEITPRPKRMGFWKHQVGVAVRGWGWSVIDGPTLCGYLDVIESHFNNNGLNQVVVYQPPESGECEDKLLVTKEIFRLNWYEWWLSRAQQELMALLFNVTSGKLALNTVISHDGAKVSQAITYVDQLIDDGDPDNDREAMRIAKWINRGWMVDFGIIPNDLPDISYRMVPRVFKLAQAYPNPFNPKATIKYEVAKPEHVNLVIYDIAGRLVKTLVDEPKLPNRYEVIWDGKDHAGAQVAAGVYFCRMVAGSFEQTHKMMLLK